MTASNFLRTALLGASCVTLLTGCNWIDKWPGAEGDRHRLAEQPQAKIMQTADSTWIAPASTAKAVEHAIPEPTNADRDAMTRLAMLEKTVQQMKNDMNTMMPVLSRLVAVQTDIQSMLARLEQAGTPGVAPVLPPPASMAPPEASPPAPPPSTPTAIPLMPEAATQAPTPIIEANSAPPPPADAGPTPTPTQIVTLPAPAATQTATIQVPPQDAAPAAAAPTATASALRIGEHPGKTRLVLDVSGQIAYHYDIDNGERILTIDLPGTAWSDGLGEKKTAESPMVSSWQAIADGQGGTRVVVQLRQPARVLQAQTMPGDNGAAPRIVLDIGGA